jgi:hypothetical protein
LIFFNRKFSYSPHFPLSLLLDKQPKWVSLPSNEESFYHEDYLSYILSKSSTHRNPNTTQYQQFDIKRQS